MKKMLAVLSAVGLVLSFHSLSNNHANPVHVAEGPLSKTDMHATRGAGQTQPPNGRICNLQGCGSPNIVCSNNGAGGSGSWTYYPHIVCGVGVSSDSCNANQSYRCSTHIVYTAEGCTGEGTPYITYIDFCRL